MSNWTPYPFSKRGRDENFSAEYLQALIVEGRRLAANTLPVIFTLGHLAAICNVPFGFLHEIVCRNADCYRVFFIKKRSGGVRRITIPSPSLLTVQRWLHQTVLLQQPTHACAHAFNAGCSPLKNAQLHAGSKWLIKIDIENFFESVSEKQVFRVFKNMGFRPLLSFELARLCTRLTDLQHKRLISKDVFHYTISSYRSGGLGHLPQGAPTSPVLANLVCYDLDTQLEALAGNFDCVYTRYADDIAFSSQKFSRRSAKKLLSQVSHHLSTFGFRVNAKKTVIAPPGARRIVTGLLVDSECVKLPREFRENIQLHLYHARKHGIPDHCKYRNFRSLIGLRNHLDGLITYAEEVEPQFGQDCRNEFDALPWGEILDV
jgi:RNA-directed DNA polymerase